MANNTITNIAIPPKFYFDFFNSEGKQRVFLLFGGNFICMKCGTHQSCVPVLEKGKNIIEIKITEFHQEDCEYYGK